MKNRITAILAGLLLSSSLIFAAHLDQVALPEKAMPELSSILRRAVEQSPRALNLSLDLEVAENNRIQARAALLPSISASVSYYKSKDRNEYLYDSSSSYSNTYRVTKTPYSISLSQPVFHWGERKNLAHIGEIQAEISKGNNRNAFRLFAQDLRAYYMRLVLLKLAAKRAVFNAEIYSNQLTIDTARRAKNLISDAQMFSARVNAEQSQIANERAQMEYENARTSFARLAGVSALNDGEVPDEIPVVNYSAEAYQFLLADFLSAKDKPTNDAVSLRRQIEIENLNYTNAKTRLRPKISASVGLTQDVQHNLYGTIDTYTVTSTYAGLSVGWTIFDGFYSDALVRNSLARRRQLETDYSTLNSTLGQQAQTQARQINFAARSMAISDRFLSDNEGQLRSKEEEFKRGLISEADLKSVKLALMDARSSAYSARMDFLSRIGEFLGTINADPVSGTINGQK